MAEIYWFEKIDRSENNLTVKSASPAKVADAFVCSRSYADAKGGVSAVTEIARSLKASRVLVLGCDDSGKFSVSTEMKGNFINLKWLHRIAQTTVLAPNVVRIIRYKWLVLCFLMMIM